jgi:hypothetical protein
MILILWHKLWCPFVSTRSNLEKFGCPGELEIHSSENGGSISLVKIQHLLNLTKSL